MTAQSDRDRIVRQALHAIATGTSVAQAMADAVASAYEMASLSAINRSGSGVLRPALSDDELNRVTTNIAKRRLPAAPPEPTGRHKDSAWYRGVKKS